MLKPIILFKRWYDMRKIVLFLSTALCTVSALAQQTTLNELNVRRQQIDKTAITLLASYSAANIVYGTIASGQTTGSNKYFHQMNAIWNGVTLGIVAVGHFTAKKEGSLDMAASLKKQHAVKKSFLFNTALDLAYVAGGAYMYEKSKTTSNKPERLKGYGQSVMLQGGVLFLFDGVMYAIHQRHGKKLDQLLQKVQLTATGNGIGVVVKL
jgi:hypothetical protein